MTPNQKAFLDMIAYSEIGPELLALSDNGYNVIVGSTHKRPILFDSYADHPHQYVKRMNSTAAGRYQVLGRYADIYMQRLGLHDFSPASQDAIALQQIKECGALPFIDAGLFDEAVEKCARIWASLPGPGCDGQHENALPQLRDAYVNAGGALANMMRTGTT